MNMAMTGQMPATLVAPDWTARRYNTSPRRLCDRALMGEQQIEDQEAVILSQVGADRNSLPQRPPGAAGQHKRRVRGSM